jgi:DNA-directed RNA polymerase subunit M/transcription elongation factor TFIIS
MSIDDKIRKQTTESLKKIINETKYIDAIEKSIYDFADDYATTNETPFLLESIYDTKVTEIIDALTKNKNLVTNMEEAKLIATLSPSELNPENTNVDKMKKKKEVEEFKKNDIKSSDAFQCSKCKKRRCTVTQKQTRAGDEPATTYVTCLECGHTFSFN